MMVDAPKLREGVAVKIETGPFLRKLFMPLSTGQQMARAYHRVGLHVFPTPSPYEVQARAAAEPGMYDPNNKPAYLLRGLFTARLHRCSSDCPIHCLPKGATFEDLFERANLAIMVGRLSGNLLAIDCDSYAAYHWLWAEFDRRKIPYWSFRTHRGGVLLVRVAEGEVCNIPGSRSQIPDAEFWGEMHYILVPPSVHPSGEIYTWVAPDGIRDRLSDEAPPQVSIRDLDWLGLTLVREERKKWEAPELYGLPAWTVDLSWRNRKFLAEGTYEGMRNHCLTAAAYDMAGNSVVFSEAKQVLLGAAERCDPPFPAGDALKILRSAYRKDRQPARKSGKLRRLIWQSAMEFINVYDWRRAFGRRAEKAKTVFHACADRSRMDRSEYFRCSTREVAEIANCKRETAGAYLNEFVALGLLQIKTHSRRGEARVFNFGPAVLEHHLNGLDANRGATMEYVAVTSGPSTAPIIQSLPRLRRRIYLDALALWHGSPGSTSWFSPAPVALPSRG